MTKTTDHPLTETRAAELWDNNATRRRDWANLSPSNNGDTLTAMRAAYDADREYVSADPYHDPRPWQDCTRKDIREGDLVEARAGDFLRTGVAHHQDDGDWCTEGDYLLTHGTYWPLRRIPAPAPPAEEVELPTEPGSVLHDVSLTRSNGTTAHADAAMLDDEGYWQGRWDGEEEEEESTFEGYPTEYITDGTLPDGTRAHRDGNYDDGTPRFVKTLDGDA